MSSAKSDDKKADGQTSSDLANLANYTDEQIGVGVIDGSYTNKLHS